ncbi:MAG: NTP transferase domain-containing protein [Candidatus Diapherotrites archaeon]
MAKKEPLVFVFAGGTGTRMGRADKCLIEIDPENKEVLHRTSLGRIIAQLKKNGVSKINVFAGKNREGLVAYLEKNQENIAPIKVELHSEYEWGEKHKKIRDMLKPSQSTLMLNADVVYRTSTLRRTLDLARKGRKRFAIAYGPEVRARKGIGIRPIFGWSAAIVREDAAHFLGDKQLGHLNPARKALKGFGLRIAKPFVNLNRSEDVTLARKILKRKHWQV